MHLWSRRCLLEFECNARKNKSGLSQTGRFYLAMMDRWGLDGQQLHIKLERSVGGNHTASAAGTIAQL